MGTPSIGLRSINYAIHLISSKSSKISAKIIRNGNRFKRLENTNPWCPGPCCDTLKIENNSCPVLKKYNHLKAVLTPDFPYRGFSLKLIKGGAVAYQNMLKKDLPQNRLKIF